MLPPGFASMPPMRVGGTGRLRISFSARSPQQSIMDGPDEVHKVSVARRVLRDYKPHEGYWPSNYLPHLREAARVKYASVVEPDPELKEIANASQGRHY